jgi:arginyl-tRNA--protein-N-Asp/Glu arginylyltransferase
MKNYLKWNEITIKDFDNKNINRLYNNGYVFTRTGKGVMNQTRSIRIDLNKFELSSENRRILKKTEDIGHKTYDLPYSEYNWKIGKVVKDFYTEKFGDGTFSANKIKELLTTEYNFNKLFIYNNSKENLGYCICYENKEILHYSYPFYVLSPMSYVFNPNTGMSMMIQAINYAKESGKKYIYLGSAKDEKAKYKLQFKGLEWFDGEKWSEDLEELKQQIKS